MRPSHPGPLTFLCATRETQEPRLGGIPSSIQPAGELTRAHAGREQPATRSTSSSVRNGSESPHTRLRRVVAGGISCDGHRNARGRQPSPRLPSVRKWASPCDGRARRISDSRTATAQPRRGRRGSTAGARARTPQRCWRADGRKECRPARDARQAFPPHDGGRNGHRLDSRAPRPPATRRHLEVERLELAARGDRWDSRRGSHDALHLRRQHRPHRHRSQQAPRASRRNNTGRVEQNERAAPTTNSTSQAARIADHGAHSCCLSVWRAARQFLKTRTKVAICSCSSRGR